MKRKQAIVRASARSKPGHEPVKSNRRIPSSLTWSKPVALWWGFMSIVGCFNIVVWFMLYQHLTGPNMDLMMFLCAIYVFGCAFRSFLPRADVQRICLWDTWLSAVVLGRSVATLAEVAFVAQWALVLHRLGTKIGSDNIVSIAWVMVPVIVVAECFSWYAVLTTNYVYNAIENSTWGVVFSLVGVCLCRLAPEYTGYMRAFFILTTFGMIMFVTFLAKVDVPMYLNRWRTETAAGGKKFLTVFQGLREVSTHWVVTRDIAEWKEEMAWMGLYFSFAVWASHCLCVVYANV